MKQKLMTNLKIKTEISLIGFQFEQAVNVLIHTVYFNKLIFDYNVTTKWSHLIKVPVIINDIQLAVYDDRIKYKNFL